MIKINLATRKRAANAMSKGLGESLRFDGGQLKAIWVQFLEFPLKKIGVALACGAIATFVLNGYKDELVKVEQAELIKVLAEKPKLEAESGKLKGLQETEKSMESDEKRIRIKLETIKKLGMERASTVMVLEEISKITPSNV